MQVLVVDRVRRRGLRRVHEVVRRQPTIEMHMPEHTGGSQALQRPVDGCAMDRRLAAGDLLEQRVSRKMVPASCDNPGEQGDPWLRDPLADRAQQLGRLRRQCRIAG